MKQPDKIGLLVEGVVDAVNAVAKVADAFNDLSTSIRQRKLALRKEYRVLMINRYTTGLTYSGYQRLVCVRQMMLLHGL